VKVCIGARIGKVKHGVTHHRITLYGFDARLCPLDTVPSPVGCAQVLWESLDALENYAFSSPQALLRDALLAHASQERAGNAQPALPFE
jgi:hypothetical protein